MSRPDLTAYPPEYLDAFAAWAHASEGTPGVEIVETAVPDQDAPHGENTEDEVAV